MSNSSQQEQNNACATVSTGATPALQPTHGQQRPLKFLSTENATVGRTILQNIRHVSKFNDIIDITFISHIVINMPKMAI